MPKCQPCDGSGLLPTGQVCTACQGRGGEGGTVFHPEDEATNAQVSPQAAETAQQDASNDPKGQTASGSASGPDSGSTGANEPVLLRYRLVQATEIDGQVVEAGQVVNLTAERAAAFPDGTFEGNANLSPETNPNPADAELDPAKVPGQQ